MLVVEATGSDAVQHFTKSCRITGDFVKLGNTAAVVQRDREKNQHNIKVPLHSSTLVCQHGDVAEVRQGEKHER